MEHILDDIKVLLNLQDDDMLELLKVVLRQAEGRVLAYIGEIVYPQELEWILTEIAVRRYNSIGSEGIHSELNEGIQYIYERNMLDEFKEELDHWKRTNNPSTLGKFKMI